ncbi:MAG: hypothetical protein NXH95_07400 [Pseudomonadaceae bacterium]|nr:hypothetical protein [Pseudomonadaceae bacterium]
MCLHKNFRTARLFVIALFASLPGVAVADERPAWNTLSVGDRQEILRALDVEQSALSGTPNLRTETGAQTVRQAALTDRWFHDQRQGKEANLKLVWQRSANLLSVSENGLSLTRRF